jgi:hypothetical protein
LVENLTLKVEIPGVPSFWLGRSLRRIDEGGRMMWGSVGKHLDGWAKFAVVIAAVGWFGLQVADRYAPRMATVTIGQPEPTAKHVAADVVQTVAYESDVADVETVATASIFGQLIREIAVAASVLAANTFAQLATVLAVGVTGGLAIRPKVNQWREAQAVRAARRRANRHAYDLRLLAAHDAKGNVPGPTVAAIQPMKRH